MLHMVQTVDTDGVEMGVIGNATDQSNQPPAQREFSPVSRENFEFRYGEDDCMICFDDFSSAPLANTLCGHAFHLHCITSLGSITCPVCREVM